jgi:PilZ domain
MVFDLRGNERFEYSDHKVEYSFDPFSNEIFEADLINVSEAGLCILSQHRLSVGQEITLRNFMSPSSRSATVIWVAEHEEKIGFDKSDQISLRVGLQFTD